MTDEEFKKEYYDLIKESCAERKKIIDKAKADGKWEIGLDVNSDLFIENDKKYQGKIDELRRMYLANHDNM